MLKYPIMTVVLVLSACTPVDPDAPPSPACVQASDVVDNLEDAQDKTEKMIEGLLAAEVVDADDVAKVREILSNTRRLLLTAMVTQAAICGPRAAS